MSELDEPTPAPPSRAGTGADLARRMDRMEQRQDTMETKVTDLAAVVTRVELNQAHATELSKLRFDAVDTAVKNVDATLERFMGRINAIVSGEVKLPQQAGYDAYLAETAKWREKVEQRFDSLDPALGPRVTALEKTSAQNGGVLIAMSGMKQLILVMMALMGTAVAIAEFIWRVTS